ncbi:MAG: hypothetical protein RL026_67 [Pseudomonadota bacterium]|jgi:intracellular sulfur oxidation DsrE/DsrF family protein
MSRRHGLPAVLAGLGLACGAALAVPAASAAAPAAAEAPVRVVYHFDQATSADRGLRNIQNHLKADPTTQVVVVSNGPGIDFMLADAKDSKGEPYELRILELQQQGVKFEVCNNTMVGRGFKPEQLVEGVTVVKAGVEEVARLQFRLGYAYIKP